LSTLSGITPYNGSAYDYTGSTPSGSTSATNTQLTNALQTQDSVDLQSDASLINSVFPQSSLSAQGTASYPTNIEQAVQDQTILTNNPNLAQIISQQSSYPTNIEQAAQDQAILTNDPNIAQMVSQQASSPAMEPLTAALQVLQTVGSPSTAGQSASSSLISAISGMEALQDVTTANAFTTNPSMAQSMLQSYDPGLNIPQLGSLVNTTA
jgi:hypothetical protein